MKKYIRKPMSEDSRYIPSQHLVILQNRLINIIKELGDINEILGTTLLSKERIIDIVERVYNEKLINTNGKGRPVRYKNLAFARHTARYLLRKFTSIDNTEIAVITGATNHSSTTHSIATYYDLMDTDEDFRAKVNKCTQLIILQT